MAELGNFPRSNPHSRIKILNLRESLVISTFVFDPTEVFTVEFLLMNMSLMKLATAMGPLTPHEILLHLPKNKNL